jgi:hypothetical protein
LKVVEARGVEPLKKEHKLIAALEIRFLC